MTNQEIFNEAIRKVAKIDCHFEQWLDYLGTQKFQYNDHFKTIFDQRFAKAFFGEKDYCLCGDKKYCMECGRKAKLLNWEYHLQQIVICEDKFKYLEKFL